MLGFAVAEGRFDGSTLTLKATAPNKREIVLTGQVSGDEIVFKSTGLPPGPIQFVARRDRVLTGSVSRSAVVQALMKQFNVTGVSIAIIKDFKVAATYVYGVADAETSAPVTPDTVFQAASISKPVAAMVSLKAVQNGGFSLDQDVNTILKSWKLPEGLHEGASDAAEPDEPHVEAGDAFGFPGYPVKALLPTLPQILDGVQPPSNSGQFGSSARR